MKDLNLPVKAVVIGLVSGMTEESRAIHVDFDSDAVVVNVSARAMGDALEFDDDGKPKNVVLKPHRGTVALWLSENQIDAFNLRSLLFKNNLIEFHVEYHVADMTEYERDGVVETHKSTLVKATNAFEVPSAEIWDYVPNEFGAKSIIDARAEFAKDSKPAVRKPVTQKAAPETATVDDLLDMINRREKAIANPSITPAWKTKYESEIAAYRLRLKALEPVTVTVDDMPANLTTKAAKNKWLGENGLPLIP
jgi:hypothetical protein